MRKFGLIGFPLGHSFSKKYFTEKFEKEGLRDCEFELFEIATIDELKNVLKANPELRGLCATIPYKQQVMPYIDVLDPACQRIGAVNCIQFLDGRLIGHNTDYVGFKNSIQKWLGGLRPKALILGTGGASKAVKIALTDLGIEYLMVSRTATEGQITYKDIKRNPEFLSTHSLIVNTTPLGTFPAIDSHPDLPLDQLNRSHLYYDLVYNPTQTAMMKLIEERGGKTINGLEMLIGQAEAAWEIWNRTRST